MRGDCPLRTPLDIAFPPLEELSTIRHGLARRRTPDHTELVGKKKCSYRGRRFAERAWQSSWKADRLNLQQFVILVLGLSLHTSVSRV